MTDPRISRSLRLSVPAVSARVSLQLVGEHAGPVEGLPTFADGLRSARIVDAVARSANTSTWTEV